MQLLFDFFPVIAFFVAYKLGGIFIATGVLIAAVLVQTGVQWLRHRKLSNMAITSAVLVLIFGGLTLWLHDESLIKWKVSVVNWLFGLVFLGSLYIGRQTIVERLMGSAISLQPAHWRRLNWFWVVFFLALGTINYYVMKNYDTDTWAHFKVYGVLGLTVGFVVLQTVWLNDKVSEPPQSGPTQPDSTPSDSMHSDSIRGGR